MSRRDIALHAVAGGKAPSTKVRDVMSESIHWAYEDDEVTKLLSEQQIRRLPIVNADKRLTGIVALSDFAVDAADIALAGRALAEISQPS